MWTGWMYVRCSNSGTGWTQVPCQQQSMCVIRGRPMQDGAESESTVSRGEDTRRVAICNMDWDHVRAVDLLAVLRSFAPPGGVCPACMVPAFEAGRSGL